MTNVFLFNALKSVPNLCKLIIFRKTTLYIKPCLSSHMRSCNLFFFFRNILMLNYWYNIDLKGTNDPTIILLFFQVIISLTGENNVPRVARTGFSWFSVTNIQHLASISSIRHSAESVYPWLKIFIPHSVIFCLGRIGNTQSLVNQCGR